MKALRYLLIVIAMVSFLGVNAQGLAQRPEIKMQSTSGLVCSGSTLPSAAIHGTYVTGTAIGTYSPASQPGGPRRITINPGEEPGPDEGENSEPWKDPIGDAALPLILLACVYICARAFLRNKKRAISR